LNDRKVFVDAIFHDPHSPSKNCELWTCGLFSEMHEIMKEDGVLTTYSSALHVRRAMLEAGLFISKYRNNLMKEGTLAFKNKNGDCISDQLIQEILNNPKSTPFRDSENLSLDRDRIREVRKIEMMEKRRILKELAVRGDSVVTF